MSEKLIPAATIILMRDIPAFEVLMIERHADIAFAGGALVFPGGRIDAGDGHADWSVHSRGGNGLAEAERVARIAAIREAFEESGILMARDTHGALVDPALVEDLEPWRSRIESDDALFLEMAKQYDLHLALDLLHLFARWRPPAAATHKRFDTWFFAAKTPPGQIAREDGNEATEAFWVNPDDAIAMRASGERKMIFPTIRNVELIAQSDNSDGVLRFAQQRKIEIIEPVMRESDDGPVITIPDDLGYPTTEESLETAFRS